MIYIVTGVSRGMGKAIVELYLKKGHQVIGVGRSHSFSNENFSFVKCDLSDVESVKTVFQNHEFNEAVTLINNAGIIGTIQRLSDQKELDLGTVMTVNVTAPMLLLHAVYSKMKNKADFTVANISSGAANRAIPSWASYCASKAALNMITEAFYLEEQEKGVDLKVYAVAPGVIDTGMQEQIRNTSLENFSALENFKQMKNEGVLFSAEEAASRLEKLLNLDYSGEIVQDLRSI
jgi:benzil reductase ((S)-benzoin forming)